MTSDGDLIRLDPFKKALAAILCSKKVAIEDLVKRAIDADIPMDLLVDSKHSEEAAWKFLESFGVSREKPKACRVLPKVPESREFAHLQFRFDLLETDKVDSYLD